MIIRGIHPALIIPYIHLSCLWTVELSLFCSTGSNFFTGRMKCFPLFPFFISFSVCPVISVSLPFLFSAPQWTCWQAELQKNSGRINYRKSLIKNGSVPCLTGQNPQNSFHHSENFVAVRQRVLLQEKGKSFQHCLFKGLCFTDFFKTSMLHKN